MLRPLSFAAFVLATSLVPACSSTKGGAETDPAKDVADGCDPIVPEHCGLPLPNDYWLATEAGGSRHLAFASATLPVSAVTHQPLDPATWNQHDGFSPGQEIATFLPGASATGLPGLDSMALSVKPDSPTLLVDAGTGELVAHFVEIDQSTAGDQDRALLLHPLVRLKDATRYIVAIRHVVDTDGKTISASPSFAALRDKTAQGSVRLGARRAHFEEIFATLAGRGVARAELQQAWDFTTASRAQNTRDMLTMRDAALALVGTRGPEYTITKVEDAPNPHLSKRVTGLMTVPLFLDQPGPGARMTRGPDGAPRQNGTAQYEFLMLIPKTFSPTKPLGILQNGHGLLGSKSEGQDDYFAQICEQYGYVGIAVDWVGMARDDNATLVQAVGGDLTVFERAVDRQHQGFVNALLAMRMMKGRMKDEPLLQVGGESVVDPSRAYYRGDSQGGIFGATYMALSTDVTRGVLGEPGAPYTLLLDRSADFTGFRFLLRASYPNGVEQRVIYALLQMSWDRTEPNGYLPYIRKDLFPGTPAHEVLLHVAIGDHQVTPLGAHLIARTIGAKNMAPANRTVYGVEESEGPVTGSAMVEFDLGTPAPPPENLPPVGSQYGEDPHDGVRLLEPATDQADHFFRTGEIKRFCDGSCNPT